MQFGRIDEQNDRNSLLDDYEQGISGFTFISIAKYMVKILEIMI